MALDKLTKVQSVGISSFIQVVGVVTATGGFVGNLTGNVTGAATFGGDLTIPDYIVHSGDSNTKFGFESGDTVTVETAGSERLRITSTGAVQITGVDDQDNLLVKSGNTHFAIHQDDSDGEVSLRAQDGSGSNNTKYMTFFTEGGSGPTERLRITSDGDVKIKSFGNASNASADALQIGKTDNNYGITILSATNAQGRIDFTDTEDTNDPQGKIAYYHDSNSLQFFTNGSAASNERLRIKSNGDVTVTDGNLVVASGHGIDFSATSDGGTSTPSELLDDYEEGSWSPQILGWNGSYSIQEGRYIKIGRKVHIIGEVSSNANAGNSFTNSWPGLSNLPFANTTSFQGVSGSQRHMGTATIIGDVSPSGTNGIAFVTFDRNDGTSFFPNHISSAGAQNFQNTMINNPTTANFGYRFNCTYYTD